jgi:hypothetical protein
VDLMAAAAFAARISHPQVTVRIDVHTVRPDEQPGAKGSQQGPVTLEQQDRIEGVLAGPIKRLQTLWSN